nr:putative aryl-alcohol dehydrogenase aad14 [Quercus suber]
MADFMKPAPTPRTPLGQHRVLSSTAGIRISPLILGGMSIGEAWSAFMGSMNKAQAFQLLDAYVAAGGNFIDTANCYQDNQSEVWIGEWVRERKNRDEVVIATKFSFHYKARSNDDKTPANNNFWGNHKRSMMMSLRDSLAKLQTDWIDVFYLHFWDFTISIEELMDSLHLLVEQGKVMYLGISDAPAWVVAGANQYARAHGKTMFSIYQGQWNILLRDLEREIVPMATYFGMAIAPWNVLGGGKLLSPDQVAKSKASGDSGRSGMDQTAEEKAISEALYTVAKAHGLESVTAVALAYVRAKAPNVLPLVGGRKVEHLHDNIAALELHLTREEVTFLESKNNFNVGFPANFVGEDWNLTGKTSGVIAAGGPLVLDSWQPDV